MAIITCPKCGAKISDTCRQCAECGFDGISSYLLQIDRQKDINRRQEEMLERERRDYEREQQILLKSQQQNIPHCPICGSAKLSKISTLNRAVSVSLFGIFSKKIGKQWHCNQCGTDF